MCSPPLTSRGDSGSRQDPQEDSKHRSAFYGFTSLDRPAGIWPPKDTLADKMQ